MTFPLVFRFAARLVIASALMAGFFVLTQDFQIFPGFTRSLTYWSREVPPAGVEEISLTTEDGEHILTWHMKALNGEKSPVALVFHGNGDSLRSSLGLQRWLSDLGIPSYTLEYRGYGASSGWPSERGLYYDSEALMKHVLAHERISAREILILGHSIGTGPATYLAAEHQPGMLVLLSPFSSLPEVVSGIPLFGYLTPFLWYEFPSVKNVSRLTEACVVIAHGMRDGTIPFQHGLAVRDAYAGKGRVHFIASELAGHNDLFATIGAEIGAAIVECRGGLALSSTSSTATTHAGAGT